ncbi:TetR/AcrR family transcriptional regulator [Leucobacter allii]|uniref:TetR/AcrR family transcriptional regulator n=1 Tax=Leucobacter allii TaxID=2932247 RepID=A0ABY4FJH8_9MICO|nr:TetR/AcrR family transcriptional regulator [Leucobacter allii]UOQ56730.1 TetR/AcrR family transcriptional regulator [Leucobacter allii]
MPKLVDHDARRRELADAVLEVIAKEGTASVTLRAVAAKSGWSTGTLNHYARNRDGLLRIALARAAASTRKIYLRADDDIAARPFAHLERILSETLPLDDRRLALTRIFIFYLGEAVADPGLGQELRQYVRNWRQDVEEELRRLIDAGHVSAERDPRALAETLVALADGFGNQAAIDEEMLMALRAQPPVKHWITHLLGIGDRNAPAGVPLA